MRKNFEKQISVLQEDVSSHKYALVLEKANKDRKILELENVNNQISQRMLAMQ